MKANEIRAEYGPLDKAEFWLLNALVHREELEFELEILGENEDGRYASIRVTNPDEFDLAGYELSHGWRIMGVSGDDGEIKMRFYRLEDE